MKENSKCRPTISGLNSLSFPEQIEPRAKDSGIEIVKNQILEKSQVLVSKGGGKADITLNDSNLGDLALSIQVDGGDVKLKIITDSEKVRDVIGQDLANLKESLRDQDLNLTNVEMNSGKDEQSRHENTQRFGSEFGQNQNQNPRGPT